MKATVVMVTVADRVEMLNAFLRTLAEYRPDDEIHIHVQGDYTSWRSALEMPRGLAHSIQHSADPLGCHAARVLALREIHGQSTGRYVNVDDDVLLTEHTNWNPAIRRALQPGTGFVLTNWARSQTHYDKAVPRIDHVFKKQVMVYNGGGMAYGETVAEMMRGLDPVPARFDDIWPLTAYLNGLQNYRYLGSLALHRIMSKGGMRSYMTAEPRPLLCEQWINYRHLPTQPVGRDYAIPLDSDLKPEVHQMHRRNRW